MQRASELGKESKTDDRTVEVRNWSKSRTKIGFLTGFEHFFQDAKPKRIPRVRYDRKFSSQLG